MQKQDLDEAEGPHHNHSIPDLGVGSSLSSKRDCDAQDIDHEPSPLREPEAQDAHIEPRMPAIESNTETPKRSQRRLLTKATRICLECRFKRQKCTHHTSPNIESVLSFIDSNHFVFVPADSLNNTIRILYKKVAAIEPHAGHSFRPQNSPTVMKISLEDPLSLDSYLEDGFPISLDLFELDYISNSQGKSNSITLKPAMYEIFDEFISQKVWRDQWNHQSLYVTKAQTDILWTTRMFCGYFGLLYNLDLIYVYSDYAHQHSARLICATLTYFFIDRLCRLYRDLGTNLQALVDQVDENHYLADWALETIYTCVRSPLPIKWSTTNNSIIRPLDNIRQLLSERIHEIRSKVNCIWMELAHSYWSPWALTNHPTISAAHGIQTPKRLHILFECNAGSPWDNMMLPGSERLHKCSIPELLSSYWLAEEQGVVAESSFEEGPRILAMNNKRRNDETYYSMDRRRTPLSRPTDELDDVKTVYSDTSNASGFRRKGYIEVFADLLLQRFSTTQFAAYTLEDIYKSLPTRLKAFALRVGLNEPTQVHLDTMFHIHKYRRNIADSFKEKSFQKPLANLQETLETEKMPLQDKMGKWYRSMGGQTDDIPSQQGIPTVDEAQTISSTRDYTECTEELISNQSKYGEFISKLPEYEWLLSDLRKEGILTPSKYSDSKRAIREHILSLLPPLSKISRKKSTDARHITFRIQWNHLDFAETQGYKGRPDYVIERAITLTGGAQDAQALSCKEYLSQVWPSSGEQMMELVKKIVSSTPGQQHRCELVDGTELVAWFDGILLVIETHGVGDTLADIGEQLAWLASALRSSPYDSNVSTCEPSVSQCVFSETPVPVSKKDTVVYVGFHVQLEQNDDLLEVSNGKCWHNLFRNPVMVKGYPILSKPPSFTGLEMPLKMMTALIQSRFVTTFNNKIFIKGFSTMLVPTKVEREMVAWHLLFNADGSHISYTSPQVQKLPGFYPTELTMSELEECRHVVGWCSSVQNNTGTSSATYHFINWSGLESSEKGCDFEKVYISRGRLVSRGIEPAIGIPHIPLHVGVDYMRQLKWIAKKFIILYDVETRRAWLVDGASALLHLVRTSLESNRNDEFQESFIFKWDMIMESNRSKGSSAAISILMNDANKELKLYSSSNYTFKDRVEQICHTLEQILIHQEDRTNLGNFSGSELRLVDHEILEGFDFMDIATEEDHFWARMTHVQARGTGWTYFTRAIHAVTLFGSGFGELITPCDTASVCSSWTGVPKGQEYLAVCVSMVKEILRKKGNTRELPWRIVRDLYWYVPDKAFEQCQCAETSTGIPCDRAQILLRNQQLGYKEKLLSSPSELKTDGAVIFGFTPETILPVHDSDGFDGGRSSPQADGSDNRFIDSALGISLKSSTSTHLLRDESVKRGRESDWPTSSIPSAKRLHTFHSPKEDSPKDSLAEGNDNVFCASFENAKGLGKETDKRDLLASRHEEYVAEAKVHNIKKLCEKDYTVGLICALKIELDAAHKMLDENHGEGLGHGSDNNYYILGKIEDHNVVLTCLAMGRPGNDNAAIVATRLMNKFPNITIGLMVGIGGGLPSAKDDIRLGDVVVSKPDAQYGGVLQYDKGKYTIDGFKCTGFLNAPPERLLSVLQRMPQHGSQLQPCSSPSYPGEEYDHLFEPDYKHVNGTTCTSCDEHELVQRPPGNRESGPRVFYGTIASGNAVIKDSVMRDRLIKEHGALCFEMEAAGLLSSNFPCIVIRGVSDYADSHKNDGWQEYAATTAAQFAKDLIKATRFLNL